MKQILYTLFISLLAFQLQAQENSIRGTVSDADGKALEGASIHWKNTTIGTIALDGSFKLSTSKSSDTLVVSFVGFDTFEDKVVSGQILNIVLIPNNELTEFEVKDGRGSNYVSTLSTLNIEHIGEGELRKAACCSLAESFETNGTVDVMYSDAVTGTKEVKMLGLSGTYSQLLAEKRPLAKGLGSPHLFDYYPGTWVKGIQLSKGIGTVENGFENIAGQINFELAKPWEDDKIFLNTYVNSFGRVETNLHLNYPITDKWSMGVLLHASGNRNQVDNNDDQFLDTPQKTTLNGLYRVFYRGKFLFSQFNFQYINGNTKSGQVNMGLENPYIVNMDHERIDVFGKFGYVGFEDPNKSIGFIYNYTKQIIDEEYGYLRPRDGVQDYGYANFMFKSKPGANSTITTGASATYSDLRNNLGDFVYNLEEKQAGIFLDFSTDFVSKEENSKKEEDNCCSDKEAKDACCSDKEVKDACCSDKNKSSKFLQNLGLISGLRVDNHNLYGVLVSPRLSLKYNFNDRTITRLNIGRGYKTPYIISENIGMLISNTDIYLEETMDVEEAWNIGVNFTKEMNIAGKLINLTADVYHTLFINKVVMDMEQHAHHIHFYNQKGQTRSTYALVMANIQLNDNLRLRGAYKYNHYEIGFRDGNRIPPLFAKNRGLLTLEYTVPRTNWDINISTQFVGKQLFPEHPQLPPSVDLTNHVGTTPSYQLYNIHINKKFTDRFEFYLGGENLGNFMQENPIIDYENPFSDYFNASHVYGPTLGIRGYMGIKWTIK